LGLCTSISGGAELPETTCPSRLISSTSDPHSRFTNLPKESLTENLEKLYSAPVN